MHVQSIQPTPNPNAFKFVVDGPLAAGDSRHYGDAQAAAADPLATAMFGVDGVETLFFCDNFATVTMTAQADWRTVADQISKILENHEGEPIAGEPATHSTNPVSQFIEGSDPEMLEKINAILDDRVRPALAGDGGGLEILGLEGKTLHIRYQGACGSCPSSIQGTLVAIQSMLQTEIDEELQVVPG